MATAMGRQREDAHSSCDASSFGSGIFNRKGGENLQQKNRNGATQANTAGDDVLFVHSGASSGVVAEGERIAVTDITERVKKKMAAKGGTNYLRVLGLTKSERIRVTRSKKKTGVGKFRGDGCTQVHKMLPGYLEMLHTVDRATA
jgi:hypothetical protein